MMLWDGRGYYFDRRYLPDVTQSQWAYLASQKGWDVQQVATHLHEAGVTHLLLSFQDMNFISQYDVSGQQLRAARFLIREFVPACTRQVYHDNYYDLLEIT